MSAFLEFLNAYAIWIYIGCVIGILFAVKMLVDSRRQARTTMFTLEQEQASDRALRAVMWLIGFMVLMGSVSAVNAFVGPSRPAPVVVAGLTPAPAYTPPVIPPTFTTVPTLTPQPPTPAPPTATKVVQQTQPTAASAQPTSVPPPAQPAPTRTEPGPTPNYPKPQLARPIQGDPISNSWIQFIWGADDQLPATLPPNQFYRLAVNWTDRDTGSPKYSARCVQRNGDNTKTWDDLSQAEGRAVKDQFSWSVVVVYVPSGNWAECDAGGGTPISPPSDTWVFYWH